MRRLRTIGIRVREGEGGVGVEAGLVKSGRLAMMMES